MQINPWNPQYPYTSIELFYQSIKRPLSSCLFVNQARGASFQAKLVGHHQSLVRLICGLAI